MPAALPRSFMAGEFSVVSMMVLTPNVNIRPIVWNAGDDFVAPDQQFCDGPNLPWLFCALSSTCHMNVENGSAWVYRGAMQKKVANPLG